MDFDERLEKAIQRGSRASSARAQAQQEQALTEEEFKRLHSQVRRELSEHIERCMQRLPDHFPGFRFETILDERGWGAAVGRDDVDLSAGGRASLFSRLETVVRPFSAAHVVEVAAKGTIRNKEVFNRTYFEPLQEADPAGFAAMIDRWVLEFAELFAAQS